MRRRLFPLAAIVPLGLLGCGNLEDGSVINDEDPLMSQNGISSNGISSNGISSNGISSNALSSNALSSNALASNDTILRLLRDPSSAGEQTRTFFRYVVNCALPAGRSVTYSWTDAAGIRRTEINPGGLGLAAGWEFGSVNQGGKELVSACLGARTNALGVAVPLSMRAKGVNELAVSGQERADFTYGEGAFWGNVFNNGSPYLYACSRSPFNHGITTSSYTNRGRTCASAGCGIITAVGRCYASDVATTGQGCWERPSNNDWVSKCGPALLRNAASPAANVISTWLKP